LLIGFTLSKAIQHLGWQGSAQPLGMTLRFIPFSGHGLRHWNINSC